MDGSFSFTRTHGLHLNDGSFLETKGYFITGEGVDDSIWFRRIWVPETIAKKHKGFPYMESIDMHGEYVSIVFSYFGRFFSFDYDYILDGKNKCMRLIPN